MALCTAKKQPFDVACRFFLPSRHGATAWCGCVGLARAEHRDLHAGQASDWLGQKPLRSRGGLRNLLAMPRQTRHFLLGASERRPRRTKSRVPYLSDQQLGER